MKSVFLFCFALASCVTSTPASQPATLNEPEKTLGATSKAADASGEGASVIVRPRAEAIELIREECAQGYDILEEGPPTAEVGVSVPVKRHSDPKSHWFMRYRCRTK